MASYEERSGSVRAIVRIPGGGKRSATFSTKAEARKWAIAVEAKQDKEGASKGETNEQLFHTYLNAVAGKTDSAKFNELRLMKVCKDPLAKLRTEDTTTHDINLWIERCLTRPSERTGHALSPATVNRELNLISGAFTYAIEALHWITVNPCFGASRPEHSRPRKRSLLTPHEIQAIRIATCYDEDPRLMSQMARVGACFLLALETGMRVGEMLRLRPSDYHRDKRYVHISASEKGGRKGSRSGRSSLDPSRHVPLTGRAIEILDQLLKTIPPNQKPIPEEGFSKPPYIVGVRDSLRDALWRKARDRAGIEDLHFHDTKHEAATRLSKFIDVLALSHAIGTKDIRLLRDTYYNNDASRIATMLPKQLSM